MHGEVTRDNGVEVMSRHAQLASDPCRGTTGADNTRANGPLAFLGRDHPAAWTLLRCAPTIIGVVDVFVGRPDHQMIEIATGRVVAGVPNMEMVGDQTMRQLVNRPMRVDDLALSVNPAGVELAVPIGQPSALPLPTAGDRMCRPDVGEESC